MYGILFYKQHTTTSQVAESCMHNLAIPCKQEAVNMFLPQNIIWPPCPSYHCKILKLYGVFDSYGPKSPYNNNPKDTIELLRWYRATKTFEGGWQWPCVRATCRSKIGRMTIGMSIND